MKRSKKKWLLFTKVVLIVKVTNRIEGDDLGYIQYCNGWRQFVWYPENGIQMAAGCLCELAEYMEKLNQTKGCYKKS